VAIFGIRYLPNEWEIVLSPPKKNIKIFYTVGRFGSHPPISVTLELFVFCTWEPKEIVFVESGEQRLVCTNTDDIGGGYTLKILVGWGVEES